LVAKICPTDGQKIATRIFSNQKFTSFKHLHFWTIAESTLLALREAPKLGCAAFREACFASQFALR
jgi:hypothetical protein